MFIETQFDIHIMWVSFGFSTVSLNILIYNMYVHIHIVHICVYCFT